MIIGGITLDNDLIWDDEFQYTPLAGSADRSIEGRLIVQSYPLSGGQPMTLSGGASNGWQMRDTVIALQALANSPGAIFDVILPDDRVFSVMFRSEEQPVMSFQPIALASAPLGDFWYYGDIKLRIVA